EPLKRQRLQIKIADLLIHFAGTAGNSRVGDPDGVLYEEDATQERRRPGTGRGAGDLNGVQEVLCSVKTSKHEDLEGQQGDPLRRSPISSPLDPEPQGDLNCRQEDLTPSRTVDSVLFLFSQEVSQGDPDQKLGDSLLPSHVQQPRETNPSGD